MCHSATSTEQPMFVLNNLVSNGQTADGWTTVQCKCKSEKVGLNGQSTCNLCKGLILNNRECKAIPKVNEDDKQRMQSMITFKNGIHNRECNGDREAIRERDSRFDG